MKDHLVFDTTDAQSILDSDNVGAWVRAGTDGDRINSQNVNSQDWLNVAALFYDETGTAYSDANPIPVDVVSPITIDVQLHGIYDVGTNPDPDNVGIIAFNRAASPALSDQVQTLTAATAASDAVVAANVHALDVNGFLMGYNGTTWDRLHSTSGSLNVNITNTTTTVSDAALANTAIAHAAATLAVADTAQAAVASPLSNRKYLWIYNNHNKKVFIGSSSVDAATGFPVSPGSYLEMRAGAAVAVNFVGQSGATPDIRTLELS